MQIPPTKWTARTLGASLQTPAVLTALCRRPWTACSSSSAFSPFDCRDELNP